MAESLATHWQSLADNPTLCVLLLASIATLAVGLERLAFLVRFRRRLQHAQASLGRHLGAGHASSARALNRSLPAHPATDLFDLALSAPVQEPFAARLRRPMRQLARRTRRRLWLVGSTASLAPFVGLLGTVLGIMRAFEAMGREAGGGFHVVSAGIGEALVTTAAGIGVAVLALSLFNALQVLAAGTLADAQEAIESTFDARALKGDTMEDGDGLGRA